jgi:hypothetical protein
VQVCRDSWKGEQAHEDWRVKPGVTLLCFYRRSTFSVLIGEDFEN